MTVQSRSAYHREGRHHGPEVVGPCSQDDTVALATRGPGLGWHSSSRVFWTHAESPSSRHVRAPAVVASVLMGPAMPGATTSRKPPLLVRLITALSEGLQSAEGGPIPSATYHQGSECVPLVGGGVRRPLGPLTRWVLFWAPWLWVCVIIEWTCYQSSWAYSSYLLKLLI